MEAPAFQVALPASTRHLSITLPDKPSASLSATLVPNSESKYLVVFINGLGLPQSCWWPVITLSLKHKQSPPPSFLTYDRFGQGTTIDTDPSDVGKEVGHGHDIADVVYDLHSLLEEVALKELSKNTKDLTIIFVANSIGVSVARYYAQVYSGSISAFLLLDSTLANSDFVSIFPDPDAPDFDEKSLLGNLTREDIVAARKSTAAIFHPSVPNKEGFSRRNLGEYLPLSGGPRLAGPNGQAPYITVVGHDFEQFADETLRMPGMKREVTILYTNPFWQKYNEDMLDITEKDRGKGPIRPERSGHFIQKDRPDFVAQELLELLENLSKN